MKYIILAIFLASCNQAPQGASVASQDNTTAVSQDSTAASVDQSKPVSLDETKPVVKPLTLKEKLSIAAKEFEPLKTSYQPFCSKTPKDLNLFYTTLFYEMIRHESGFKNEEAYYECAKSKCYYAAGCFIDPTRGFCRIASSKLDNGFAVSRGLFQLSVSSSRGLGCGFISSSDDLHNPDLNIKCALTIYKNYIIQDKIITGKVDDKWKGGARYWAVLRPEFDGNPRNSFLKITKEIQKLEGCQ